MLTPYNLFLKMFVRGAQLEPLHYIEHVLPFDTWLIVLPLCAGLGTSDSQQCYVDDN